MFVRGRCVVVNPNRYVFIYTRQDFDERDKLPRRLVGEHNERNAD
jgi:hypothetical protein